MVGGGGVVVSNAQTFCRLYLISTHPSTVLYLVELRLSETELL